MLREVAALVTGAGGPGRRALGGSGTIETHLIDADRNLEFKDRG